jgi:hypothetical protein
VVDPRRRKTEYRAALFAVAVVGATAGVGFDYVFTSGQGAFMYWLSTHFWRDAVQSAIIGAVAGVASRTALSESVPQTHLDQVPANADALMYAAE